MFSHYRPIKTTGRQTRILALLLFAFPATEPLLGQLGGLSSLSQPAAKNPENPDPLGRDTPYGCVVGFLKAAELDDYNRAVEYLDMKPSPQALERARQLRAVLNAIRGAGLDALSRTPEGDLGDDLPPTRERVGIVASDTGTLDLFLDRVRRNDTPPIWLFSSKTLHDIPAAFEEVEPGFEAYIPQNLRDIRILSIPAYRWLGAILGIGLVLVLASLGTRILFPLVRRLVRRLTLEQDDLWLNALRKPFWLILVSLGFRALAEISPTALGRQFCIKVSAVMAVFAVTWMVVRLSDIVAHRAANRLTNAGAASKLAVLSLFHRLFKIAAATAGGVVVIYAGGGDVTAILAGVGLGGIVIALAAQKTLENLFGGVALISDEPIRVGDFCRFEGKVGIVEDIGLRSARVRTLDRTILSIPNGQLSTMTLENFTLRDKFLFHHKIDLRYETTPDQMRCILIQIRELLRSHPKVDQQDARVRLIAFGASAFTLEVFTYLLLVEHQHFLETQEELLLTILDIVVAAGGGLAFPSTTMYMARDKPQDLAAVEQAADRLRQRGGQVLPVAAGDLNGAS